MPSNATVSPAGPGENPQETSNNERAAIATSDPTPPTHSSEGTGNKLVNSQTTTKTDDPNNASSNIAPRLALLRDRDDRDNKGNVAAEKVLSVSANLAKLLPSGAVLVFQTLSASFTNQGSCNTANKWLSALLVGFLTAACIFLTFTDSIVHDNRIYYGVALPGRLKVFALSRAEERRLLRVLKKDLVERRLKTLDWVHAFFTAIVFLSIAMGDVGLQKCFFPDLDSLNMRNVKELLRNAPLGLALLSSFVFMIFPTTRHGVGFDNGSRQPAAEQQRKDDPKAADKSSKPGDIEKGQAPADSNKA
ncbi:hypothetical protein GQ55_4G237000 [Panicum hallii var. hallii]|uniref:Uncharacterized protein n=1 Tax=Panicum hallii var. hallii TaxID=1504633 RepID=A0A2T7DZM2_9POAL|nr:hypothetical protein GQ55_4G237000 [Panicum hallii var. hallii]